ncbi:14392_t:CDS:2, partial [Dentiscutata erythropus]
IASILNTNAVEEVGDADKVGDVAAIDNNEIGAVAIVNPGVIVNLAVDLAGVVVDLADIVVNLVGVVVDLACVVVDLLCRAMVDRLGAVELDVGIGIIGIEEVEPSDSFQQRGQKSQTISPITNTLFMKKCRHDKIVTDH